MTKLATIRTNRKSTSHSNKDATTDREDNELTVQWVDGKVKTNVGRRKRARERYHEMIERQAQEILGEFEEPNRPGQGCHQGPRARQPTDHTTNHPAGRQVCPNVGRSADQPINLSHIASRQVCHTVSRTADTSTDRPVHQANDPTSRQTNQLGTHPEFRPTALEEDISFHPAFHEVWHPHGPTKTPTLLNNQQANQQILQHESAPWPPNLLEAIREVISTPVPLPEKPRFGFQLNQEAAAKNMCIMRQYNLDLGKAIEAQSNSPLGYGSEFRPVNTLERVFGCHPNWIRMRRLLLHGSDWPLSELSNESRAVDLKEATRFGNHKVPQENQIC